MTCTQLLHQVPPYNQTELCALSTMAFYTSLDILCTIVQFNGHGHLNTLRLMPPFSTADPPLTNLFCSNLHLPECSICDLRSTLRQECCTLSLLRGVELKRCLRLLNKSAIYLDAKLSPCEASQKSRAVITEDVDFSGNNKRFIFKRMFQTRTRRKSKGTQS